MTDSRVDATTDPADAASVSPPAGRPARPAGPEPRRRPAWTVPDWRDRDHQAYGLLLVMLAGAVGLLVYLAHDLWFVWGDDYDFFLLRGTVPVADRGIWAPHDDHWMTAIVLIDRVLLSWFGLGAYLPYVLVSILLHAASVLVVHAVLARVGVGRWVRVATCTILAFAGAGAQAVLWNTTAGLIGSMFFGWVAVLAGLTARDDDAPPWRVWLPLALGLTFSGTGIVAVAFVGAFAWCRRGVRSALTVISVPAGVFLVWYLAVGHTGAKAPLDDRWAYLSVPRLVWIGLTHAPEAATGIEGSGPLVLGVLVVATLTAPARVPAGLRHLACAGLLAALAQLTLAAVSRPTFGAEAFAGGRYAYLTLFFLSPCLAVLLTRLTGVVTAPRRVALLLAAVVGIAYVVNAGALFKAEHDGRLFVSEPWPGLMRGLRTAAQSGEQVLTVDAVDEVHQRFRADLAAREEMWSYLPQGRATTEELVYAESQFFTGVSRESFNVGSGDDLRPVLDFDTTTPVRRGCRTLTAVGETPVIAVDTGSDGAQFGVQGPTDRIIAHVVRDKVQGPDRIWTVDPEVGHWVGTSAGDAELVVNLTQPGTYTVCKL